MDSMPLWLQYVMQVSPSVALSQAILYWGAGLAAIWNEVLALAVIGALFFAAALIRFRRRWQLCGSPAHTGRHC